MAAQRFARSAAAKTVMFNPESGSELSERGKELQAEMKQALLAQQKEDEDRLVEVKAGRAAAEYAKLKKKAVVEAGRMGKVSAVDLAAALDKLSLNADGKVIAALHRAFQKAEGAPCPSAKALLASVRIHLATLVAVVAGKPDRMALILKELETYTSDSDGRVDACVAALPKIVQTMYDADVLEEEVIMEWWAQHTAKQPELEVEIEPAQAHAEKVANDLEKANKNVKAAEVRLEECKKTAKLADKEVSNARTGGNPTSEEQLREKEARRADKHAKAALAQALPKHVALQKTAGELFNELPRAREAAAAAELAVKANIAITKALTPLIEWLAEDEDEDEDSDSDDE